MSKYGSLANWDGSRSLPSRQHGMSATPSLQESMPRRRADRESHTRVASTMRPPPLLPPQLPEAGGSMHPCPTNRTRSWSTGQVSSDSSHLESEDERKRVVGMLLESDEERSASPAKSAHHWEVPISVLLPISGKSWESVPLSEPPPPPSPVSQPLISPPHSRQHITKPTESFIPLGPPSGDICTIPPSTLFLAPEEALSSWSKVTPSRSTSRSRAFDRVYEHATQSHTAFQPVTAPSQKSSQLLSPGPFDERDLSRPPHLLTGQIGNLPPSSSEHDSYHNAPLHYSYPITNRITAASESHPVPGNTPSQSDHVMFRDERADLPTFDSGIAGTNIIQGAELLQSSIRLSIGTMTATSLVPSRSETTPVVSETSSKRLSPSTKICDPSQSFTQRTVISRPGVLFDTPQDDSPTISNIYLQQRAPSTGENGPAGLQAHQTVPYRSQLPVRQSTPTRQAMDVKSPGRSSSSSPHFPLSQRVVNQQRHRSFVRQHGGLQVYVEIPPMSSKRKREQFRSDNHKRKRSHEISRSYSTRSPPAKKQRKQAETDFPSSIRAIGLQSLGHEAYDSLQPFYEYTELQVDEDLDLTVEDRVPNAVMLDKLLRPTFRHLCASFLSNRNTVMEHASRITHRSPIKPPPDLPATTTSNESKPPCNLPPSQPSLPDRGIRCLEENRYASPTAYPGPSEEQHLVEHSLAAVRGHDAFLGVDESVSEVDVYVPLTSIANHSRDKTLAPLEVGAWSHPPLASPGGSLAGLADLDYRRRADAGTYIENGTINPSLLEQPRITSPSHTPSLSPELSPPPRSTPGESIPRSFEGKGKERAHDVGIRTRKLQMQHKEVSTPSAIAAGKRNRKLSAKARETIESLNFSEDDLSEIALSTGKVHAKPSATFKLKLKVPKQQSLNDERSFCHQCRRTNHYEKMQCSVIKENGAKCTLLFCENCIIKRYSDIEFNGRATDFVCPRCADSCNCTSCCSRRGETYVSTKHVKTGLELAFRRSNSTKAKKIKRTARRAQSNNESWNGDDDASSDVQVLQSSVFTAGEHWGAVYDLSGRMRVGDGVVADSASQRIVIMPSETALPLEKPTRKRTFIGQPRPMWQSTMLGEVEGCPTGHAYIGKKEPLFNSALYQSFEAVICFEGPLTPPSSQSDNGEDGPADQEPSLRPLDQATLVFTLASLLGNPS